MRDKKGATILTLLIGVVLFCVLVVPLVESLRGAFLDPEGRPTVRYVVAVFESPVYRDGFLHASAVAIGSTLLAVLMGLSIAFVLDRYTFPAKRVLAALVPLPLMVPPFVGAIGLKQLLGQNGAVNALLIDLGAMSALHPFDWLRSGRLVAVVMLTALHLYPIVYFNASAALASLGPEIEEAAASLGANAISRFFSITLPLVKPSLLASGVVVFISAFTELGVPLMCDYTEITSVQIYGALKDIGRNPIVHGLVAVVLVATVALYVGARWSLGPSRVVSRSKGTARRAPRVLGSKMGLACSALVGGVLVLAALPNVAVVLVAATRDWYGTILPSRLTWDHFEAALGHALVVPSIGNSLKYVSLSTLLDLVLGIALAHVVVRGRVSLAKLVDAVAMLPLAVPGLVMAFGYLAVSREGRVLSWLNPVRDPTALLVVAYAVRRLPFVVRSASAGIEQIDETLEDAAGNLGATPFATFRRVTLPLLLPFVLAGGVFAFALSMLEVSDSLILAQRQATFPVTKAIYELFQLLGDGRFVAAALGVWVMVFLAVSVGFAGSLVGRRVAGMFRI